MADNKLHPNPPIYNLESILKEIESNILFLCSLIEQIDDVACKAKFACMAASTAYKNEQRERLKT